MPQRMIKIVLPEAKGEQALELLQGQENLDFWQEESSGGNFVASALIDSGHSEAIMDLFENRFSSLAGFKLILLPVEASIPHAEVNNTPAAASSPDETKTGQKNASRISREELYAEIVDSAKLSNTFVLMTVLSTIVAAIGLLKNNVAVIIGAMVIAPFLGPNVALALSVNLADKNLGLNSLKTLLSGILLVILLSVCMGLFFDTNPAIPEIASRTRADLSDIILALASGCAGVLAFTTGASSAVIGVMVAVALLPPLTVCGLLLSSGRFSGALAAWLLFITNIICINLSGVITFFVQGVTPLSWWEADKAKKATRKAMALWAIILAVLAVIIYFQQTEFR